MGLLTLAWYAYIPIIAGVIVTVGGAIAVLTSWGRGVVTVAQRLLRSRRRLPPAETPEPTEDQRKVLNAGLALPASRWRKVTPRSQLQHALENTVTVSINEQGRSVLWDFYRVPLDA